MEALPPRYSQEHMGGKEKIIVKFYTQHGHWTWFATEGNPVIEEDGEHTSDYTYAQVVEMGAEIIDWHFFGYVDGDFPELGYFALSDLQSVDDIVIDENYGMNTPLCDVL